MPGITVEQMEMGVVQSKLRNPVLAGLLRDIPGYMERMGSGVRFMLDETKRLGLPAPTFREMSEFVVTFKQAPDLARSPSQVQPQYNETLWSEQEQPHIEELVKKLPAEQESRLTEAMAYVHKNGFITNKIYRGLTGISDRTAHRDLETLVERGGLKGVGQKGARRYVLA